MSSAIAFADPEVLPDELGNELGMGELFDALADSEWVLPCRSGNADLWFAEKPTELEHAKLLCVDCPVRAECLAGAVDRQEPWGVWGGEIFEKGAVVEKKRSRGRPRKNAVSQPSVEVIVGSSSTECRQTVAA